MRFLLVSLAAALLLLAAGPVPERPLAAGPAAAPTCAAGPTTIGEVTYGTPCADVIVAPAGVEAVQGGAGDDTIIGANSGPVTAVTGSCDSGCHLEVGSQTFEGGLGNDIVYGDRGNDTLRGNAGNDRLYGGIGDDGLEGGEGNDLLSGGFGADKIDGQEGSDYIRGDGTIDHIFDTGLAGIDTLSYSTGITPGFGAGIVTGAGGFPSGAEGERGVYLNLGVGGENADNGIAQGGGGHDEVQPGAFERVVGSPFSDYIVGSSLGEAIYGGGGADVIKGEGGNDTLNGGADGDYLDGGTEGTNTNEGNGFDNCVNPGPGSCGGSAAAVSTRDTGKVSVGMTSVAAVAGFPGASQIYVIGGEGGDSITATYGGGAVSLSLGAGSFDTSAKDAGGCSVATTTATCTPPTPLDSILLAGMAGNDSIAANGFPDGVGVVAVGGAGEDHLTGGGSEDVLVDGNGASADTLAAGADDDALIHNDGADSLDGGEGSDLFLSVALCKGESIVGGAERVGAPTPDRDNASWARLGGVGVGARIDQGRVGEVGPGGDPQCASGSFDTLSGIEDLEGSNQNDYFVGDAHNNQLLGHKGADSYFGLAGQDSLLANSGTRDLVIDCGADLDSVVIDLAAVGDPAPIECESVREGAPEEFKELELLAPPPAPPLPSPPPPPPPVDRNPPRTELRHHPAKVLRTAPGKRLSIVFRFASSEPGSRFRCKLDRRPYRGCISPRAYKVALGRHAVRILALDAAGNADPTPALFRFAVRRR
jgi:Ca2+-binding RTX toxin-like protein